MNKPRIREDLADLKPYHVPVVKAKVELDKNENPWNLPAEILSEIEKTLQNFKFNRYPDIATTELRRTIASYYSLDMDNVLVGSGSNEVILDLMLAFGGAGRVALTFEPTYSMHSIIARISGTRVESLPLTSDFEIDVVTALSRISETKPDVIFVCNPNNPTGNLVDGQAVEEFLKSNALVIVDEAYGEFSKESVLNLLPKSPNLAIVKTFSKAFRLASLRVGYLLANRELVGELQRVKLSYNVNAFSQMVAEIVFSKRHLLDSAVEEIIKEGERLVRELKKMSGLTAYPSRTNFILFRTERDAGEIFDSLVKEGILLRNFSHKPGLENCLRVTVGTQQENDNFLEALQKII